MCITDLVLAPPGRRYSRRPLLRAPALEALQSLLRTALLLLPLLPLLPLLLLLRRVRLGLRLGLGLWLGLWLGLRLLSRHGNCNKGLLVRASATTGHT